MTNERTANKHARSEYLLAVVINQRSSDDLLTYLLTKNQSIREWLGGVVVGRRTCDREDASSTPG